MLSKRLIRRLLKICEANYDRVNRRHRHFSFLCHRSNIIAFGYAQKAKTHTKAERWFQFNSIHSEFDALRQVRLMDLTGCYLVNIRILLNGRLSLSRPCKCCARMITELGVRDIYYSQSDGSFGHMRID